MQGEKRGLVREPNPILGHHAERKDTYIRPVDLKGNRYRGYQASQPSETAETDACDPSERPIFPVKKWQVLYQALLLPAYDHADEDSLLGGCVQKLAAQLKEVEEERESDRTAEEPCQFFSRTLRKVARRKRATKRRPFVIR